MVHLFTSTKKAALKARDAGLVRYFRLQAAARSFLTRKEEGATLVEYALLIALIGIACIGAMTFLAGRISGAFSKVGSTLPQ